MLGKMFITREKERNCLAKLQLGRKKYFRRLQLCGGVATNFHEQSEHIKELPRKSEIKI